MLLTWIPHDHAAAALLLQLACITIMTAAGASVSLPMQRVDWWFFPLGSPYSYAGTPKRDHSPAVITCQDINATTSQHSPTRPHGQPARASLAPQSDPAIGPQQRGPVQGGNVVSLLLVAGWARNAREAACRRCTHAHSATQRSRDGGGGKCALARLSLS